MTWEDIIDLEKKKDYYKKLKEEIDKRYETTTVFPEKQNIFKAFFLTKLDNLKVVILGQDPYYNGNANGYAFGCKQNVSASLLHILKSIRSNTDAEILMKKEPKNDASLKYLVEQGVFLLNTILTVRAGQPESHANIGWQPFTTEIIGIISDKRENIVFMLWGAYAKAYKPLIDSKKHLILEWSHPASAAHNNSEWNCTHFKECNEYLQNKNITPINWY